MSEHPHRQGDAAASCRGRDSPLSSRAAGPFVLHISSLHFPPILLVPGAGSLVPRSLQPAPNEFWSCRRAGLGQAVCPANCQFSAPQRAGSPAMSASRGLLLGLALAPLLLGLAAALPASYQCDSSSGIVCASNSAPGGLSPADTPQASHRPALPAAAGRAELRACLLSCPPAHLLCCAQTLPDFAVMEMPAVAWGSIAAARSNQPMLRRPKPTCAAPLQTAHAAVGGGLS